MMTINNPWKLCLVLTLGLTISYLTYKILTGNSLQDLITLSRNTINFFSLSGSTRTIIGIIIVILGSLTMIHLSYRFISYLITNIKQVVSQKSKKKTRNTKYNNQLKTPAEYRKQTEEKTAFEMKRLEATDDFIRMRTIKGEDNEKWNWQVGDRMEREKLFQEGKKEENEADSEDEETLHRKVWAEIEKAGKE